MAFAILTWKEPHLIIMVHSQHRTALHGQPNSQRILPTGQCAAASPQAAQLTANTRSGTAVFAVCVVCVTCVCVCTVSCCSFMCCAVQDEPTNHLDLSERTSPTWQTRACKRAWMPDVVALTHVPLSLARFVVTGVLDRVCCCDLRVCVLLCVCECACV